MSNKLGQMVLVGFGPHDLDLMLSWRGTEKEKDLVFAPDTWAPRFRPETSCTQKEIETFMEYVGWATTLLENIPKEKE